MCSDVEQSSCVRMSSAEYFLVKEEPKEIKLDILSESKVDDPDYSQDIVSDGGQVNVTKQDDQDTHHKDEEEEVKAIFSSRESKKPCLAQSEVEEYDEGFKTPTSSDHKIPVVKQCPPAPRKTRSSTKRKLSPSRIRRRLQLDVSAEIESMFPPRPRDDNEHKIKKARSNDDE
ncbi:cyclin-dependent protein kinase inhibitor SMR10-like [Olea europaea var. sylvestris]|uniref:cyclin-dependent protein kinase inhibitor SMR10-like n=1 Tax=Olea europaea var. sylvestris TaxID=158386 RepID=UPI000C1CF5E1|nr:cyclin-dependent protein kinase inhibitor SMR10-like [Olea europaea var. sylvestris]